MSKLTRKLRVTTVLLVFGFSVSLTSLLYGISAITTLINSSRNVSEYAFSSQAEVKLTIGYEELQNISDILTNVDGVATSDGLMMYVSGIESTISWTVLLNSNDENLKYPLKWGRLPSLDGNEIAIPETAETFATKQADNMYLDVQGVTYQVVGVFDTENTGAIPPFVVGYLSIPTDIAISYFSDIPFRFALRSDNENVFLQADVIKENLSLMDVDGLVSFSEIKTDTPIFLTMENTGMSLAFAIYAFSIANSLVVTNYWAITKRRDMAIQKAFGWSNKRLVMNVITEMGGIIGTSIVIGLFALNLISYISGSNMLYELTPTFVLYCIGVLLITLVISITIPILNILKIQPVEVIE